VVDYRGELNVLKHRPTGALLSHGSKSVWEADCYQGNFNLNDENGELVLKVDTGIRKGKSTYELFPPSWFDTP